MTIVIDDPQAFVARATTSDDRAETVLLAVDLDSLDAASIAALQQRNLRATVQRVRGVAASQARWPGIESVTTPADLAAIPLFSPQDLEALSPPHTEDLILDHPASGIVIRSSGTSRRRKVLYHSWAFNQRVNLLGARGLRHTFSTLPHRIANCLHGGELNGAFGFAQEICRYLNALCFPLGSSLPLAEAIEVMSEHTIDTLISSPSYAMQLLTQTSTAQLASLRNLLYIGEAMGEARHGALTEKFPQLNIRSLSYSTSELGPIGYQCRYMAGTTHHIHEDGLIVEILGGEHMTPMFDGQAGEVVVTSLADSGMPLFRYRIGDKGVIKRGQCDCGSHALQLTLLGRVSESLNVDGTTISRDLVMATLREFGFNDPSDCQFQIWTDPSGFRIRLLLAKPHAKTIDSAALEAHFRAAYHMMRVFTGPGYRGFDVIAANPQDFERTARGKSPFFVERT